jgi:hypothetical protein
MLARSSTVPTRAGYAFEPKLDGFRALLTQMSATDSSAADAGT